MEKVLEKGTFWKGNLSWNTRVKGHPVGEYVGALLTRVPAGLPTLSP